ncbi:hypothetical protein VCV18_003953 [Metarhizium anisopliae]
MYKTGDYANWDSAFREISINRKDRFRFNLDDLEARSLKTIPECGGAAMLFRDDHLLEEYHIPSTSRSVLDELDIKTFVGDALTLTKCPGESLCCRKSLLRRQTNWIIKSLSGWNMPGLRGGSLNGRA